jgi:hypothetical protein
MPQSVIKFSEKGTSPVVYSFVAAGLVWSAVKIGVNNILVPGIVAVDLAISDRSQSIVTLVKGGDEAFISRPEAATKLFIKTQVSPTPSILALVYRATSYLYREISSALRQKTKKDTAISSVNNQSRKFLIT